MSTAILLNWLNVSTAMSLLASGEQPIPRKQLRETLDVLLAWYQEFTDIPAEHLAQVKKHFDELVDHTVQSDTNAQSEAIFAVFDFLCAYMKPAEIVNMSQFQATEKESTDLLAMTEQLSRFHDGKLDMFKSLLNWIEKADPLFPVSTFRDKLACCYSTVRQKACHTSGRCLFESPISWMHSPTSFSETSNIEPCFCKALTPCLGKAPCSSLSSCNGEILACSCVKKSNNPCDCKAGGLCVCNRKEELVGFGNLIVVASGFDGKLDSAKKRFTVSLGND
jgi:hypothetical protein